MKLYLSTKTGRKSVNSGPQTKRSYTWAEGGGVGMSGAVRGGDTAGYRVD